VVFTSSPLLLDRADRIVFLHDGRVAAVGIHRDLLHTEPRYRAVVTRETDEETAAAHRDEAAPADARRGDGDLNGAGALAKRMDKTLDDDVLGDDDVLHRLEEIEETA